MRIISDKQKKDISMFFDRTRDTASRIFLKDGTCVPVALFKCEAGDAAFPLSQLINHKDAAAATLNHMIEMIRPLAFVFVTEAWTRKAPADGPLPEEYMESLTEPGPTGERVPKPGVVEAVMLQCSSLTGENFMLLAEIVRDAEKATLKPWERVENRHSVGRFVFDVIPLAERQ